ncbi:SOS response-associated peptidase family protein [uncultured Winogradskyella sp.]|uniref:SOS response-associated peptidase n=1 Tax=uncultured Winogradskyella sp. TaxID=395353 RepID=UPI0026384D79|nr:SOS response-associated peptidase family protein [uncultured Winogradskyella sp.]
MCYRLSNTANKHAIEEEFNVQFKYPKLHRNNPVINGLEESFISVITMEEPKSVSYAIWGILPKLYEDDWEHYQNIQNTLNIEYDKIDEEQLYSEALMNRRCLIIVTGFFTYYLHKGELYPYYVHLTNEKPFALAGIYNQLKDGFITCALILSKANSFISKIHNSNHSMPFALDEDMQKLWLDDSLDYTETHQLLGKKINLDFSAHPIAKEFHKIGVTYDSVLEPVFYKDIPKQ